ncbi:MAG: phosphatidate cytidylyltransferase, partial [Rhodocyclaceae bacterium]|nr:phosphatidate cytidylyltransferase [Rhodocyclaceae bacterium]
MLRARVLTALVLVTLFAALLFLASSFQWVLFAALVAAIGAWEWGALIRLAAPGRTAFALAVAAIVVSVSPSGLLDAAAWPAQLSFALSALFWLLLVPFWLRGRWAVGAASGILVGVVLLVPTALA